MKRPRAGRIGVVVASRCSVRGASAVAEISRRSVAPTGAAVDSISTVSAPAPAVGPASVGADEASTDDAASPPVPVAPSLRRSVDDSGARTTTCLTASCPRSMDWATRAVPRVATADPMATPMIVPLTPKTDAMTAAITAPAAEARIWRNENFTPGISSRARAPRRRGRRTRHDSSRFPSCRRRSLPHGPVDLLAQKIGVPVVPRVLLDHVDHDPPQRKGRLLGRHRRVVEAPGVLDDGA